MMTANECPCQLATPVAVLAAEVEIIKREQAETRADYKKLIWAILYASAASTGTLLMMLFRK